MDDDTELKPLTRGEYVIHEVEWLLNKDGLTQIANRLGYSNPESLTRALIRFGRPDLAYKFVPVCLTPRDVNVVQPPPRQRKPKGRKGVQPG